MAGKRDTASKTQPKEKQRTREGSWKGSGYSQEQVFHEKRAALLRRATMQFRNWNYHAITMDQIAEDLGVAKPTLYSYVKSKQEILYEGHKLSMEFADRAVAAAEAAEGSAADKIKTFCTMYCALLAEGNGGSAITLFIEALPEEQRKEIEVRRRRHRQWFEGLIARGIEEGSLRSMQPVVAAYFFMGAVNWLLKWYQPDKSIGADDLGEQFAALFLDGIRVSPA